MFEQRSLSIKISFWHHAIACHFTIVGRPTKMEHFWINYARLMKQQYQLVSQSSTQSIKIDWPMGGLRDYSSAHAIDKFDS